MLALDSGQLRRRMRDTTLPDWKSGGQLESSSTGDLVASTTAAEQSQQAQRTEQCRGGLGNRRKRSGGESDRIDRIVARKSRSAVVSDERGLRTRIISISRRDRRAEVRIEQRSIDPVVITAGNRIMGDANGVIRSIAEVGPNHEIQVGRSLFDADSVVFDVNSARVRLHIGGDAEPTVGALTTTGFPDRDFKGPRVRSRIRGNHRAPDRVGKITAKNLIGTCIGRVAAGDSRNAHIPPVIRAVQVKVLIVRLAVHPVDVVERGRVLGKRDGRRCGHGRNEDGENDGAAEGGDIVNHDDRLGWFIRRHDENPAIHPNNTMEIHRF